MGLLPQQVLALTDEYQVLHLIYHRSHNQHRQAVWWGSLNVLHRNLRKILLNAQRNRSSQDIIDYLYRRNIFTRAFYEFNGMLALGQYVTLGLALLGCVAKVYDVLQSERKLSRRPAGAVKAMGSRTDTNAKAKDEDLGEAFEPVAIEEAKPQPLQPRVADTPQVTPPPAVVSWKPKEKKKKKKKKSAIDDIFG